MRKRDANIKPHRFKADAASTADEARRHRELSVKGGIASGEARRKRISLREELQTLLSVDDGMVAKSIVVAIAREAKAGNVGAFKAIASVLGELQPEAAAVAVTAPPVVLGLFNPERIAAERKRNADLAAEIRQAAEPTA